MLRPRRLVPLLVGFVAAGAAVGGCSSGGAPAPAASTAASTPAPSEARPDPADGSDPIAVVLSPGRITVGGNALVLEAPARMVRAYLGRALGEPTSDEVQQCGPGPLQALAWRGVTVYLAGDRFAGWYLDEAGHRTDRGIGIGSTRAAVAAAHPEVVIEQTSLGSELSVPGEPGLSGVLEGAGDDAEVVALWSGATCVAR